MTYYNPYRTTQTEFFNRQIERTYLSGPNIGGAPVGEFLQVHINGAMEYDLVGEVLVDEIFLSSKR